MDTIDARKKGMVAIKVGTSEDSSSNTAKISMDKASKDMGKNLVKDAMREETRTHIQAIKALEDNSNNTVNQMLVVAMVGASKPRVSLAGDMSEDQVSCSRKMLVWPSSDTTSAHS